MGSYILKGRTAIITGARRGIGKECVRMFTENGANIFAILRKEDAEFSAYAKKLAETNKVQVKVIYAELSEKEQIGNAIREIRKEKMPIDILVNAAGISQVSTVIMTNENVVREQINVNYIAPFLLSQGIVKLMQRNKSGSIINITSLAAWDGPPGQAAYAGSKAALNIFTKSLMKEVGILGIRVNNIAPGVTETDLLRNLPTEALKMQIESSNLKKAATTLDIANAALFLASDLSSYVTGETIRVDGGR